MSTHDSDNIYASEELETTSEEDPSEIVQNLMPGRMNTTSAFDIRATDLYSEEKCMVYGPEAQKAWEKIQSQSKTTRARKDKRG